MTYDVGCIFVDSVVGGGVGFACGVSFFVVFLVLLW